MLSQDNNVMTKTNFTSGAIFEYAWADEPRLTYYRQQLYILLRRRGAENRWDAFRIGYYNRKNDKLYMASIRNLGYLCGFFEHETVIRTSEKLIHRINVIAKQYGYLSIHHLVKAAHIKALLENK